MKELRTHLQAARSEYDAARYPGDLAAQVFSQRQTSRNGRWVVGVIFAVAAVLFVVLWMNVPAPRPAGEGQYAGNDQEIDYTDSELADTEEEYVYTDMPILSFPAIPEEVELTPAAPSFSVEMPSFSLLTDESNEQEPNI